MGGHGQLEDNAMRRSHDGPTPGPGIKFATPLLQHSRMTLPTFLCHQGTTVDTEPCQTHIHTPYVGHGLI